MKITYLIVLVLASLNTNPLLADNLYTGKIIATQNYTDGETGYCGFIVEKRLVTGSSTCAQEGNDSADFYYRWECADEKRKGMFASALAAFMGNKNVVVQVKSGDCEGTVDRPYSLVIRD